MWAGVPWQLRQHLFHCPREIPFHTGVGLLRLTLAIWLAQLHVRCQPIFFWSAHPCFHSAPTFYIPSLCPLFPMPLNTKPSASGMHWVFCQYVWISMGLSASTSNIAVLQHFSQQISQVQHMLQWSILQNRIALSIVQPLRFDLSS